MQRQVGEGGKKQTTREEMIWEEPQNNRPCCVEIQRSGQKLGEKAEMAAVPASDLELWLATEISHHLWHLGL